MRSERALRRLVAELAMTTPEDIEAVLAGLDERQRGTVEALLAAYRGEPVESAPQPINGEAIRIEGVSPWLALRLETRTQSGGARPGSLTEMSTAEMREAGMAFTITPTTFEALRSAAATLQDHPRPANAKAVMRERDRPGWMRRRAAS